MSDGYPSMTALLGLLALAGYQNRDKSSRNCLSEAKALPHQPEPRPATKSAKATWVAP